jgi:hypothetical protein
MICVVLLISPDGRPVTTATAPGVTWNAKECDGWGRGIKHEFESLSAAVGHPEGMGDYGYSTLLTSSKTEWPPAKARATDEAPIFLLVNTHYGANTSGEPMVAFRSRVLCEAAIRQAKKEVAGPEFPPEWRGKSYAWGLECIPYKIAN